MGEKEAAHAQTCDPVSGMTVKRAVSSSSRTQAIFSRELRAPINLLKVRMFFNSVLNLMMGREFSAVSAFAAAETSCPVVCY